MPVVVVIESKEIIKRKLSLKDFIFDGIGYGVRDNNMCLEDEEEGEVTVLYFYSNIQRGIEITFDKGATALKLELPSSEEEIRAFYAFAKHICEIVKADTFIRNDEEITFDKIEECVKLDIDASVKEIWNMRKQLRENNYRGLLMVCAVNPIFISEDDFAEINDNLGRFGALLHRLQSMDVYYASSRLYKKSDGTVFGAFIIINDVETVLPEVPVVFTDEFKVEEWYVVLNLEGGQAMAVDYKKFCESIDMSRKYDATHFIVSISKEKSDELVEKYGVNMF